MSILDGFVSDSVSPALGQEDARTEGGSKRIKAEIRGALGRIDRNETPRDNDPWPANFSRSSQLPDQPVFRLSSRNLTKSSHVESTIVA